MSAHEQVMASALDNQAFALMSRLHVILRRQNGRITDIEYMRRDPAYCRHVLELASAIPNDDLRAIADKLRELYFGAAGLFVRPAPKEPLVARLVSDAALPPSAPTAVVERAASRDKAVREAQQDPDRAYIGKLR